MSGYSHYERLSSLDRSFIELEDENCHMHIGAVAVFEKSAPVDLERVRHLIEVTIHRVPRYRQRLKRIPGVGRQLMWVDDPRFNLDYHLRHTHLPPPGDERTFKRLVGRLMSQQLDRGKPLWEMWVVDGVGGDRFGLVTKVHHCMIDGVGGVEVTGSLMRPTPDADPRLDRPPPRWLPRPEPTRAELLLDELTRRAVAPLTGLRGVGRALRAPVESATAFYEGAEGLVEAIGATLRPASPTPLNCEIGPHRRFDWAEMDLGTVRQMKSALGGTVNDVVLSVLTGALARFLSQRGTDTSHLDFRAMVPVNVRSADERTSLGNRVTMMVVKLPIDERDPRKRLERVSRATRELKESRQADGVRTIEELGDWAWMPGVLITELARLSSRSRPFNIVVTNVPGPQFPVYVLGERMIGCYPLVPLFKNQALGVALLSYDGRLYWGFNTDWDAVPDLHDLVEWVGTELERLREAAGVSAPDRDQPRL